MEIDMAAANQEIKELKQELKNLAEMVKDSAKTSIASNVIGLDRGEIRKIAKKAGKSVRGYFSEKSKQAAEMRDEAKDTITANPFRSVATAVAVGAVIGAILRRK
jgi:ElaB/YqjD/DUF883 family membrane-anchored ribosome-binding protein